MKNKSIILNIHSNHNLKLLFSYLDYQYLLKLIKYNKNLQNKLEIKLDNYKNNSNYPKYIIHKRRGPEDSFFGIKQQTPFTGEGALGICCLLFCSTCIHFTYTLIYTILLVCKDTFNDYNISSKNYKEKSNIIDKINISLFALIPSLIIGLIIFLISVFGGEDINRKRNWKNIIIDSLLILYNLIIILFEALVIWKLVLSYEIKKDGVMWFIIMDFIFIVLHFLYILFILLTTYQYFYYYVIHYDDYFYKDIYYSITSLNNIRIKKFNVSEDFLKMGKNEKSKFLLDNYKNMEYTNSPKEEDLINLINEFREKNNLPIFQFQNSFRLPNYVMNELSEIMINPEQNLFVEYTKKKYLFKYFVGEFKEKLKNKESNIISVLLNGDLNTIRIITKDNTEFIYIYQL